MTNAQKSEVIIALCGLLKETTQKRLVVKTGDLLKDVPPVELTAEEVYDKFIRSSTTFQKSEVEYYNTIFSEEEVNTLKRKLLKLTQEL